MTDPRTLRPTGAAPTSSTAPRVLSVNVGAVREIGWRGKQVRTGIWKYPVVGRSVALRGVNLDGDDQADRTVHGGVDKAVYAYAIEDYQHWSKQEGVETHAGLFGENLTVQGLDLCLALVGECWAVGTAVLEVVQPRLPCFKLGIRMGDAHFPKRFLSVNRLGAYLRIVEEGHVRADDAVRVSFRPEHGVTLGSMAEVLQDRGKAAALLAAPRLPEFWRRVAEGQLDRP